MVKFEILFSGYPGNNYEKILFGTGISENRTKKDTTRKLNTS